MRSLGLIHPTVWPQYTNVADRTDRQRSDSIGRTVLQTVAKNRDEADGINQGPDSNDKVMHIERSDLRLVTTDCREGVTRDEERMLRVG